MSEVFPAPRGESPEKKREVGASWARPVEHLRVTGVPEDAVNLNVDGRRLTGPMQGFGQLWRKTYRVRLSGVQASPQEVIREWKANFSSFWPEGNRFYGPARGIAPGDVAVLNLQPLGGSGEPAGRPVISTGIMVVYADEETFSFMTTQGHMFCAMITFSAFDQGGLVAQVEALLRTSDPVYEAAFRLGFGHKSEDEFWMQTLKNLAAHFGVQGQPVQERMLVDPHIRWNAAGNLWHNAAVRSALYWAISPLRWAGKKVFSKG